MFVRTRNCLCLSRSLADSGDFMDQTLYECISGICDDFLVLYHWRKMGRNMISFLVILFLAAVAGAAAVVRCVSVFISNLFICWRQTRVTNTAGVHLLSGHSWDNGTSSRTVSKGYTTWIRLLLPYVRRQLHMIRVQRYTHAGKVHGINQVQLQAAGVQVDIEYVVICNFVEVDRAN